MGLELLDAEDDEQGSGQRRPKALQSRRASPQDVDGLPVQRRVPLEIGRIVGRGAVHQPVLALEVGLLRRGEEEGQALQGAPAQGLRNDALHTSLLDAHIDDAGHIVREGQVGIGLDKEQDHDGQNLRKERFQVTKQP